MIFLYTIFCFLILIIGRLRYKNFFNPICLYTLVWFVAVCIHQSGLIEFYQLTRFCWIVIFISHFLFVGGCILGCFVIAKKDSEAQYGYVDETLQKQELLKGIVLTMSLAGIAIIANLKTMVAVYGFNLFEKIVRIYADRMYDLETIETIPYLGSFMFIALPLLGCYLKKYGFHFIVIPCVILVCANSLISGGRAGIIFSLLLFLAGYFSMENGVRMDPKGRKIFLILCSLAFVSMIVFISQERTLGVSLTYATNDYVNIFGNNIALYKGLVYIAGPIGTLNEYLKTCDFNFGQNTFLTIYNILAKFGLCDRINQYQEYFVTPVICNVGTWVREIIEDFTLFGAVIFIPAFGFLSSFFYIAAVEKKYIANKIVWSAFAMVIILSFFDWKFRASNIWIAVFFGYLIGSYIDRKSFVFSKEGGEDDG